LKHYVQTASTKATTEVNPETAKVPDAVQREETESMRPPSGAEETPLKTTVKQSPNSVSARRGRATIKAELEALKNPKPTTTPIAKQTIDRRSTEPISTTPSKTPLPLKYSQLLGMFSKIIHSLD